MTKTFLNRSFYYLAYLFLAAIFTLSFVFSNTSLLIKYPELAVGITLDLTLMAPLLYAFVIWKTKIPKTTIVPFFVISTIIASNLVPADQQFYLSQIKTWVIPIIEIGVLGFLAFTVYKTVIAYRAAKDKDSDIFNVLFEVSNKLFGNKLFAKLLAFELAVIYFAFFSWRKPKLTANTFTYHKKSGKLVLYGAIIFIIVAEAIVIHILLAEWNFYVAWILTLSSLYLSLQLFAHFKAMYQRPIEIIGDKLYVRYGLFGGGKIELRNIERIESSMIKPNETENVKQVSLLGEIEQFNTKIQLKEKATFSGFYGKEDDYKTLLLFVDEKEEFKKLVSDSERIK